MGQYIETTADGARREMQDEGKSFGLSKVITADTTLTHEDSGKLILVGTDALTITLPSTALGLEYTFVNIGADDANIITVSPAAADGIGGTITLAASVVVRAGTVDTDLTNTKSGANHCDSVKIVGTGVAGTYAWVILSNTGIWA